MSKFKCYECEEVFDEDDSDTVREYVGEFWGQPSYQNLMACPNCGCTDLEDYYEEVEEEDPEE